MSATTTTKATTESKSCVSCAMPLRGPDDFPLGDTGKSYCRHCARPDGSMKSYDEVLLGMAGWLAQSQGLDASVARDAAKEMMAKMPAWRAHA
jgi:Putative zinc ribbon domain